MEMSDPKGQVNVFQIRAKPFRGFDRKHCARLRIEGERVSAAGGLRLGMARDEVRTKLPMAKIAPGGALEYRIEEKRYWTASEPAFARWRGQAGCFEDPEKPYGWYFGSIKISIDNGRVSAIVISRNASVC